MKKIAMRKRMPYKVSNFTMTGCIAVDEVNIDRACYFRPA
jgi:hypothetical protein